MTKTTTRKKAIGGARSLRMDGGQTPRSYPSRTADAGPVADKHPVKRPVRARQSLQNLIMAAMVALGCWGFAISLTFFTNDPDRRVLGGMTALLAMTWSVYFGIRLRKWLRRR